MSERYVLTGGFGSGKTTILEILAAEGITVVPEFARAILAEQRAINGDGAPERNPQKFLALMVERALDDHAGNASALFDRGLPDLIAYAQIFELDETHIRALADTHRYAPRVFFLPSWEEIYTTDDERHATFEESHAFGELVRDIYSQLGYEVVDVPKDTPSARARFVSEMLNPGTT